jgi:transcriptional regulator with XRE-family HTH domain
MARGGPLALKLRVLRAQHGLSIEAAAQMIGVTPETLGDAERGKRRPYTPTLTKIARGYGIPVEELMAAGEDAPLDDAQSRAARNAAMHTHRVTKDVVLAWGVEASDAEVHALNRALDAMREHPDLLTYVLTEVLSDAEAQEWERTLHERTAA